MNHLIALVIGMTLLGLVSAAFTLAQGPPPASCEEQLDNEMFQKGAVIQQLAVARAQLRAMTKERDEVKAALAKATPKPAAAPEPPKAPK